MRYIKKLGVVLSVVLALNLCACSAEETESKSLYRHGLDVISLMSEMTESEKYVELYTGDSDIKAVIEEIGSMDYSQAEKVYEITISDEILSAMAQTQSLENTSDELQKVLKTRVLASFMTQMNGMAGVEKLAASSVCTMGKTFVTDEKSETAVIYIYTFSDAYPVSVTFVSGED